MYRLGHTETWKLPSGTLRSSLDYKVLDSTEELNTATQKNRRQMPVATGIPLSNLMIIIRSEFEFLVIALRKFDRGITGHHSWCLFVRQGCVRETIVCFCVILSFLGAIY